MRKSYHITPLSVAKYDIMLKTLYRALYVEYHRIVYTSVPLLWPYSYMCLWNNVWCYPGITLAVLVANYVS